MKLSPRDRPAHLQLIAISWNFGWPVAAGVVIGVWIDNALGTSPVAVLTFGLGAMVGGVWRLVQLGKRDLADIKEEEERERASHGGGSRQRTDSDRSDSHQRSDPAEPQQ